MKIKIIWIEFKVRENLELGFRNITIFRYFDCKDIQIGKGRI